MTFIIFPENDLERKKKKDLLFSSSFLPFRRTEERKKMKLLFLSCEIYDFVWMGNVESIKNLSP